MILLRRCLFTQVLDLNDNCITEIPQAFGALKKLVRINLAGNEIADKQMLRVVKAATTEGAKKLKNFVTHCKKKGKKTKPTSTKVCARMLCTRGGRCRVFFCVLLVFFFSHVVLL